MRLEDNRQGIVGSKREIGEVWGMRRLEDNRQVVVGSKREMGEVGV